MYETKTDTAALAWSPTGWPGVSMKMLQQVESIGGMIGMMRMEAGSSIPPHSHTHAARLSSPKSDQAVFVIEGDLIEEGVTYGPGSLLVAKAGTPHGPHGSSGGCVLLSTYFAKPDFVPSGRRPGCGVTTRRRNVLFDKLRTGRPGTSVHVIRALVQRPPGH